MNEYYNWCVNSRYMRCYIKCLSIKIGWRRMHSSVAITGKAKTNSGLSITHILFTCVKLVSNWSFFNLQQYKLGLDLISFLSHPFGKTFFSTHNKLKLLLSLFRSHSFSYSIHNILFIYFWVQFYCFSLFGFFDVWNRILVLFEVSVNSLSKTSIISSNFHTKCFLSPCGRIWVWMYFMRVPGNDSSMCASLELLNYKFFTRTYTHMYL